MITVLYICIDSSMGGSVISLFRMINAVKEHVYPIVLFPEKGLGYDFFISHGIECYTHRFIKFHGFKKNSFADVWKRPWRWHRFSKIRIDIGCALYVWKCLRGRGIDIVHTNTSPNNVGIYISHLLKAKHVWHIRECLDAHGHVMLYGGREKLARQINQADARIAVSQFVKKHWNLKDYNTFVISNQICHKDDAVLVLPKEKYILFVSNYLTEVKGTRKAILAFGLSGISNDGYKLKLVGNCDDNYCQSLLNTAEEYHCKDALEFIPFQYDIKPLFAKAAAFIMASEYEGLGRTTAESMFYGCPVIAHASGGTLDMINDGKTGFLFTSTEECAQLIRKVCLTNQIDVIHQAQEFAISNLSIDSLGERILKVYQTVIN